MRRERYPHYKYIYPYFQFHFLETYRKTGTEPKTYEKRGDGDTAGGRVKFSVLVCS